MTKRKQPSGKDVRPKSHPSNDKAVAENTPGSEGEGPGRLPLKPGVLLSCGVALILGLFVFAKMPGLRPNISDENIYFYMATSLLRGSLPYRDFFYANPPGLLLVLAVAGIVGGSSFAVFKTVSLIAGLTTGLLLFLFLYDRWRNWAAPLFGLAIYLFGYDQLRASTHCTGVGVTLCLIVAGLFFIWRRYPLTGGILLAFASLTKTFGLVGFPALAVLAWTHGGRKDLLRFLAGFAVVFAVANLVLLGVFRGSFVNQTILYHFNKPEPQSQNSDIFLRVLKRNLPLMALGVAGALSLSIQFARQWTRTVGELLSQYSAELSSVVFIVSLATFMALQKRIYDFYLVIGFPFAAILAASLIPVLWRRANGTREDPSETATPERRPSVLSAVVKISLAIDVLIILAFMPFGMNSNLWGWTTGFRHYWKHEAKFFEQAPYIASELKGEMLPDDTIFGDSVSVPAVAVMAGVRIWGDEADTNSMRFRSGTTDLTEMLGRMDKDRPRYILLRIPPDGSGFSGIGIIDEFRRWVAAHYGFSRKWTDSKSSYYLFEDKSKRDGQSPE